MRTNFFFLEELRGSIKIQLTERRVYFCDISVGTPRDTVMKLLNTIST